MAGVAMHGAAILFHFVINISQETLAMTQTTKCIETGVLALLLGSGEVRPQVADFLGRFGFAQASLPLDPFLFGLDSI